MPKHDSNTVTYLLWTAAQCTGFLIPHLNWHLDQSNLFQGVYTFQEISMRYPEYIKKKKFQKIFSRDKPYNIEMQVKFVMSISVGFRSRSACR